MSYYKLIETQTHKGHQSWNHDEYRKYVPTITTGGSGAIRRVSIKRDAYDHQSNASVYQWSESNGWLLVLSLPIISTPAGEVSYVHDADEVGSRLVDTAERLFTLADELLG